MQPPVSSSPPSHDTTNKNTTGGDATWTRGLFASIWGFFSNVSSGEDSEADAVGAWVGVRSGRGRGRCRSVGEVR
ncbi:hypothetical protein N7466_000463 [Penicillium verhagenii]|uniref:uncharacterized protein n=1 Tax=Penicillium verhagenii TaxID=1562060 RepID=UPI00254583A2|nr:uncharacterized protein N7466_000463 [Penicillium verhagenii]KAJ5947448.1 hypothetical protein N7466_000463 [Penicillium verhagenii]